MSRYCLWDYMGSAHILSKWYKSSSNLIRSKEHSWLHSFQSTILKCHSFAKKTLREDIVLSKRISEKWPSKEKIRFLNCYVISNLLYDSECWTIPSHLSSCLDCKRFSHTKYLSPLDFMTYSVTCSFRCHKQKIKYNSTSVTKLQTQI